MPVNDIWTGATNGNWTVTTNWSNGTAPATGDTETHTGNAVDITLGLSNAAVVLAALNTDMSFTGNVGTSTSYLQVSATIVNLFRIPPTGARGTGAKRFNLNLGSTTATVEIFNSASSGVDSGQPPIRLLGSALTVNMIGGIVGIASTAGETATISNLNVSNSGIGQSPQLYLGAGVTISGNITQTGGTITCWSAITIPSLRVARSGATFVQLGTGNITNLYIDTGAKMDYDGTGTVGNTTLAGTLDLSGGGGTITFTNFSMARGAKFVDPSKRAVFTNPIQLLNCSVGEVDIDVGQNRTLAFG